MNPYVVTTLGGLRLPLWQHLVGSCPEVFREAKEVYALVHDPRDYHSIWWTTQQGWTNLSTYLPIPVGIATRQLLRRAVEQELPVLHLEDDWECAPERVAPEVLSWLELAIGVLEANPEVGQVRLRSVREYLERGNLVMHDAVRWELFGGYRVSTAPCQANFPPALWRPEAILSAFPDGCDAGEPDPERAAGLRFGRAGWHIAQLWPGVFRHTGKDDSLIHGHTSELHQLSIEKHHVEEP